MRADTDRMRRLLEANDDVIHKQDAEVRRLAAMMRRMEEEALRQRKEYDQVINERDILGTQLIRRNDELALLYEKLKIQQSTLAKGEASYAQRMVDLRALRLKAQDLARDLALCKNSSNQVEELKREALHMRRDLLQEKTKVKALSEELENPMNVHRWRKLEGSDPAMFEMIQKVQTLQRRLIAKTEEVVERDLLLQEKQKLYVEIKAILARQPGPEVAEQLTVYQASLKEKTRQLKAMAAELNMSQAQVNEFKYEMERLSREAQDVKRKYYEQKRRDQMLRELKVRAHALHVGATPVRCASSASDSPHVMRQSETTLETSRDQAMADGRSRGVPFSFRQLRTHACSVLGALQSDDSMCGPSTGGRSQCTARQTLPAAYANAHISACTRRAIVAHGRCLAIK
eukprot:TRINITY_DN2099_c0_g1_i1.p1 TRINITY_DN2099_c0_g1~~TRINITY_DN2099_c0_g1_i1.p1  ORF type:complete len:402 (-),score=154.84 TRINITY_DN2099_c0_g1_i1:625-1830(-)